jgi:hypothetical protein
VLPTPSIGLLPRTILIVHDAMPLGIEFGFALEEGQTV